MTKCGLILIPVVLFIANLIISVATGFIVLYKDRISDGLVGDIPKYNLLAGVAAVYVTLSVFFKVLCCRKSSTLCGLSVFSFLLVSSLHAVLLAKIVGLSRDERKFYKNEVKDIYNLSICQLANCALYLLLLTIRLCIRSVKDNKINPEDDIDIFV